MNSYSIHEIIHSFDYGRSKERINLNLESLEAYYNDPAEFNAFFQQAASYFYSLFPASIKNPSEAFRNIYGKSASEFSAKFWQYLIRNNKQLVDNLNKHNKIRWKKRIYDLYFNIKGSIANRLVDTTSKDYRGT